jgi:hypothetical protein
MSASAVVVPTKDGVAQPADAAAVTQMKGGALVLSPLPLSGGRRLRKTKKVPKKVLALFKKGTAKKLRKLMKGGETAEEEVTSGDADMTGAEEGGRRRRSRKARRSSRKTLSRRRGFLY